MAEVTGLVTGSRPRQSCCRVWWRGVWSPGKAGPGARLGCALCCLPCLVSAAPSLHLDRLSCTNPPVLVFMACDFNQDEEGTRTEHGRNLRHSQLLHLRLETVSDPVS